MLDSRSRWPGDPAPEATTESHPVVSVHNFLTPQQEVLHVDGELIHRRYWWWSLLARRPMCRCGEHHPCARFRAGEEYRATYRDEHRRLRRGVS